MTYLVLILIQAIFGINFVTSKYVLYEMDTWVFVFLRFFISGTLLALIVMAWRRIGPSQLLMSWNQMKWALALGTLGFALAQTLMMQGLQLTTATNTAIISTSIPLLSYIVAILRGKRGIDIVTLSGFILAVAGVLILQDIEKLDVAEENLLGDALVLMGCFLIACFISYSKDFFSNAPMLQGNVWLFLFGALFLSPFLLLSGEQEWVIPLADDPWFQISIAFSILGATLASYFLGAWALRRVTSEYMALYSVLQPMVAGLFGYLWLGENLTWSMAISAVLIFSGILIVSLKEMR
ncbi:DMT family transporter [Halorhodospira halochloris]|uniref:DMT family transporter n=1 Tax=Halorhodospira halochloris TaxID=1052 RepID=UPI001EE79825|nr:DMT family transporter [Halorhodospira halochloris]MCG5529392.1 DMT family transporter [Halorhodospira halochloris]